jgi:hypothetical protein
MPYSEHTYFKLRSAIDTFDKLALDYGLGGDETDETTRLANALAILKEARKKLLMLQGNSEEQALKMFSGGCPEGLNKCDGDCVPYPCPYPDY